ncbi:hypothetical protein [Shewanella surugensis]|uniref:Uncharacterized protein n=1 Tax=Shewanella surugensis TaxID=212020 RepID=A0ABT0LK38_9GAMM|nr:hypothetical protein [Shewanella surugensis]MCL1127491.1 hypothetical protein [Shewanella surugensis]
MHFSYPIDNMCILAKNAQNDYEKASVFSATESLVLRFLKEDDLPHSVSEKIYLIRYHICAFIGYEHTNGISVNEHIHQASVKSIELADIIRNIEISVHKKNTEKKNKPNTLFTFFKGYK